MCALFKILFCCNNSDIRNSEVGEINNKRSEERTTIINPHQPDISVIPLEDEIVNENSNPSETLNIGETNNLQEAQHQQKFKEKYPELGNLKSAKDLKELNVRELKILLTLNRVNFKGCIEKSELYDKAYRLWEDNKFHSKDISENSPTSELCKLCMNAPLECVLLECGHIASCINCAKILAECPICRQYVVRVVRTFKV